MGLFGFRKTAECSTTVCQNIGKVTHGAIRIGGGDSDISDGLTTDFHITGKVIHDSTKGGTSLRRFDTGICHKTDSLSSILSRETKRTSDRSTVFEGFTHHGYICICIGRCCSEDVCKMTGVFCRKSEGSQGIGYDVRGCCEVFTRGSSKVHDTLDTIQHIFSFPTGHRHVVHSFSSFGCGELSFSAHFTGFISESIKVLTCSTRNSSYLTHCRVKVSCCLYCGDTNTTNYSGDAHHLFTSTSDGVTNGLHLLASHIYFRKRSACSDSFLLQAS